MKNKIIMILIIFFTVILFLGCDNKNTKYSILKQGFIDTINIKKNINKQNLQEEHISTQIVLPEITHKVQFNTSMGKFIIGLYGKDAPKTVENFLGLIKKRFYNGILIHRVAKRFLIQMGDNLTKSNRKKAEWGTGGESFFGKEFEDELNNLTPSYQLGYIKGTVAMANKGPNTNKSQFFISLDEAVYLDKKWTIFGKVIQGMDVVEKISNVEIEESKWGNDDGIPKKPIRIFSVNLID